MFWDKDKIPNYINMEDDLFKLDDGSIIDYDKTTKEEKKKKDFTILVPEIKLPKISLNITKENLLSKSLTLVISLMLILSVMILTDIISVTRYNNGPFFARHTISNNKYDEYKGVGYKVIKYHIVNGKNTTEIGNRNLKYNDKPIKTNTFDLALLFKNDFELFVNKYLNKYVELTGKVSVKDNKAYLYNKDIDGKYDIEYVCNIIGNNKKGTKVVGIISNYNTNKINLNNCYVK
jgi:hypothetical protein